MKAKRKWILIFILALTGAGLAGCGRDQKDEKSASVEVNFQNVQE